MCNKILEVLGSVIKIYAEVGGKNRLLVLQTCRSKVATRCLLPKAENEAGKLILLGNATKSKL
jgi:hypothetical protein